MRSKEFLYIKRSNYNGWLFSAVFTTRSSLLLVVLLFVSFLIQPIHKAMANEQVSDSNVEEISSAVPEDSVSDSQSSEQNEQEVSSDDTSTVEGDMSQTEEPTSNQSGTEQKKVETETDNTSLEPLNEGTEDVVDKVFDETTPLEPESEEQLLPAIDDKVLSSNSEDDSPEQVIDETEELADESNDNNSPDVNTSATSTDDSTDEEGSSSHSDEYADESASDDVPVNEDGAVQQDDDTQSTINTTGDSDATDDTDTPQSTTTDLIDGEIIERGVTDLVGTVVNDVVALTRQLVTEENFYQFSRQSCVAVGDGTYHCTVKERPTIDPTSAVYAERDESGDMEIYLRTAKGDIKQLSDNDYDDTSPDMDMASMRVVWQRLIDGRYQIISYDLEERKETQLTFSRTNSMEPKVSKEGVVWQEWDGNDWEIMFFDGQFTDQITDNEIQDVTPVLEDGYILWSVLGGKTSEAMVYSIESGEFMNIAGHEGGAVANPRFVLVYDTKFDNGDIITQGFDPVTGLASPISAKPAEQPFDIPEPDPVGEIRALIQNKSNQKDTEVVTVPVVDGDGEFDLELSTEEPAEPLNLVNTVPDDEDVDQTISMEESDQLILTEYDLVISDNSSSTNSVINKKYNLGTTSASSTQ